MTGLIIKDWKLLKRQGRYYGIVVALACVLSLSGSQNFSSFITTYLTFMITMFAFSSFNYDDFDNGMLFLMALPSGRHDYVKAKYVFSILLITGGWILGVLLHLTLFTFRFSLADYLEILPSEPVYLLLCLIYIGFAFPLLMKYGAEKGRNLAFIGLGILAAAVYLIAKTGVRLPALLLTFDRLLQTSPLTALVILTAGCILVLWISCLLSMRIMEKKEF